MKYYLVYYEEIDVAASDFHICESIDIAKEEAQKIMKKIKPISEWEKTNSTETNHDAIVMYEYGYYGQYVYIVELDLIRGAKLEDHISG